MQASKQVASNRKGLEPPPHTHRPGGKDSTSEVCIYSFSFPDQHTQHQKSVCTPSHFQTSKQAANNRKGLEPPPHTHRPASKHPTSEVCIYFPSSPGQQTSRQQQKRFRAAPSHPQSSKQAPNIRSLYLLLLISRPASKQPTTGKV